MTMPSEPSGKRTPPPVGTPPVAAPPVAAPPVAPAPAGSGPPPAPPAAFAATPPPAAAPSAIILQRFLAAERVHGMYPANSPNVRVAMTKLRESLASLPPGQGIQFDVERDTVRHGDEPILAYLAEVQEFANRLYVAHIARVVLEPEVTDPELVAVFDLFRMKPEARAELGPIEDILAARGVKHVFVREAGRVKVIEEEKDPDAWDIETIGELEELEKKIFGQVGRTGFKEVLRSLGKAQNLRASRMVGMLERPGEFAQYLVELASRLRPRDRIDLNAQLSFLEALLVKMEPVIERLPDEGQIRFYLGLDEVTAWLAAGIHRAMFAASAPPFVRLGSVAGLFPEVVRDLDVVEAFAAAAPSAGLAPVLLGGLRRVAAGDADFAAFLNQWFVPATEPDLKALASYRPPPLAAGAPDAPPLALPPDYLVPGSSGPSGAMSDALGRALAQANPALDLVETVVDLFALGPANAGEHAALVQSLVDCFVRALEAHNVYAASAALRAIYAERARSTGSDDRLRALDGAVGRCGEPEVMRTYAAMLAEVTLGSDEHRLCVDLIRGLRANAVVALIDLLAAEPVQSTRRKLLDVLASVGPVHLALISSYGSHPQWYVVRNVVWILGNLGPLAVQGILAVAAHREPRVRREAVRSLARIATPEAVRGILGYLQDRDEAVLREAVARLAALRVKAAAGALNGVLRSPRFPELSHETMTAVARALAAAGDAESAQLLDALADAKPARGWLRAPEVKSALKEAAAAIRARSGGGA